MSVLQDASISGQPFRALPEKLHAEHVRENVRMAEELRRVFHCPAASVGKEMVLVWALDRPYTHSDGHGQPSTIVYIEKAVGSARRRWPMQHLRTLAQDFTSRPILDADDLRHLARQNRNYSFYSKIVESFGPLSVWQASTADLNAASCMSLTSSRAWEHRILLKYIKRHGCLPLKNRRT